MSNDRGKSKRTQWIEALIVLGVLAALLAVARLHTYDEPIERDLVTYMLVGHAINMPERQMYADAWDLKPPGLYLAYAAAERLVGYGEAQLYLLGVASALVTLVGVWWAGGAMGRACGLWAALFWILIASAPSLEANMPNTEVFVNAFSAAALGLLLRAEGRGRARWLAVLGAGAAFAIGSTFKQTIVFDAALIGIAHMLFPPEGARRRDAVVDVMVMALLGVVVWLGFFAYFLAIGDFELFWVTNFLCPKAYSGSPLFTRISVYARGSVRESQARVRSTAALTDWTGNLATTRPVTIAAMGALPWGGGGRPVDDCINWCLLAHYYQYWLPLLAIGAAWAAASAGATAGRVFTDRAWCLFARSRQHG